MKKLLFSIILFFPLISNGQIIIDEDNGKIDLRDIDDKFIQLRNYKTIETTKGKFSLYRGKKKKKFNTYDGDNLISLSSRVDVLNFFDKYGWEYIGTETDVSSNYATKQVYDTSYSTFKKNY
tara:strand:- start:175 stop:540 length:366 start_codon:yes stop_codon:yes gene_type:complete